MSMTEFIPSEWTVQKDLVFQGVTYSSGEPVPALSVEEAESLAQRGVIVKIGGKIPERVPETPEDYMQRPDPQVLRMIRVHKPSRAMLKKVLMLAVESGRAANNRTLHEALLLELKIPVEE